MEIMMPAVVILVIAVAAVLAGVNTKVKADNVRLMAQCTALQEELRVVRASSSRREADRAWARSRRFQAEAERHAAQAAAWRHRCEAVQHWIAARAVARDPYDGWFSRVTLEGLKGIGPVWINYTRTDTYEDLE